jgi:DNA-binding GntR family transcriptional regulator
MPWLYDRLLEEVLQGNLKPGELLVESALGEKYGVSRTPVREALRMLEQDGVLERVNRGIRVRQTSADEVLELYDVRAVLEGIAARDAAERRTEIDLAALDRMFRAMENASDATAMERAIINRSFHRAIWAAAKNRTLSDLLERLGVHLRRYPATTYQRPGRWEIAIEEHRAILEAIRSKDATAARSLSEEHMSAARNARLEMIRNGDS